MDKKTSYDPARRRTGDIRSTVPAPCAKRWTNCNRIWIILLAGLTVFTKTEIQGYIDPEDGRSS